MTQENKSHNYYDFIAIIAGGIGPDAWDTEVTCAADNILKAAEYFHHKAQDIDGDVISIERLD